jgi:hypothetical protein
MVPPTSPPSDPRAPLSCGAPSLGVAEDRLTWIFGSSRSGSTWLLRMLASVEGVVPIDDPHLGHHLGVWRPISLAWATAEHPPDLTTLDRVKHDKDSYFFSDRYRDAWEPALRRLIVERFDAQVADTATTADPLVVVKEPGSHVADVLLSLFPRSRLAFLLRDGRDVVDSWLAAYRAGSWALDEGAFPVTDAGRAALVRWQSAVWTYRTALVRRVFDAHPEELRVMVRYEDLVADPEGELTRLCDHLPVRATADTCAAVAARHAFDAVPSAAKGETKEIRSATPGGWRENLTAEEHDIMHEVMGRQLADLGYLDRTPAGTG